MELRQFSEISNQINPKKILRFLPATIALILLYDFVGMNSNILAYCGLADYLEVAPNEIVVKAALVFVGIFIVYIILEWLSLLFELTETLFTVIHDLYMIFVAKRVYENIGNDAATEANALLCYLHDRKESVWFDKRNDMLEARNMLKHQFIVTVLFGVWCLQLSPDRQHLIGSFPNVQFVIGFLNWAFLYCMYQWVMKHSKVSKLRSKTVVVLGMGMCYFITISMYTEALLFISLVIGFLILNRVTFYSYYLQLCREYYIYSNNLFRYLKTRE